MNNLLTVEQLNTMAEQIEATKLSLIAREESKDYFEAAKERFIKENQDEWRETGKYYRSLRVSQGLSQADVAYAIGVSPSKISNFENGHSISHAKLVEKAYKMSLAIDKEASNIKNIETYVDSVIGNIEGLIEGYEPGQRASVLKSVKILSDYLFNTQIRLTGRLPIFGSMDNVKPINALSRLRRTH